MTVKEYEEGLRQYEQDFLERLETEGNSPGWTPHHRDSEGYAVMRSAAAREDGTVVATYMTIKPDEIVHSYASIEAADGTFIRYAKLTVLKETHARREYGWT